MLARKLMRVQGAEPTYIEDVFSVDLYEGNDSVQTVVNGIDFENEEGLVWFKNRSTASSHALFDTVRGENEVLKTNSTDAQVLNTGYGQSFNDDGFTIDSIFSDINAAGDDYAAWSFRKAPKFLDIVEFNGTGSPQTIAHELGCEVGVMIVRDINSVENWAVYHRGATANPEQVQLRLNQISAAFTSSAYWNDTAPTSTDFTVGTDSSTNALGSSYIAYLIAHNDGDGGFGDTFDQDVIKCGSYVGTGVAGNTVVVGFELQYLEVKKVTGSDDGGYWYMTDTERGLGYGADALLASNSTFPESSFGTPDFYTITSTGFILNDANYPNTAGETYIYIAIAAPV